VDIKFHNHLFSDLKMNGRTFDVNVFIAYYIDEPQEGELEDSYIEVDDFSLADIYEKLPGGNQIVITWDDPIRFDILDLVDDRLDEALVDLNKDNE
jgi:hypothetical protein